MNADKFNNSYIYIKRRQVLIAFFLIFFMSIFILYAYFAKKSKLAVFLILLFSWLQCVFITESFDLLNMEFRYYYLKIGTQGLAIGYDILFNMFQNTGVSFTVFKMFTASFSLLTVFLAIKKTTNNISMVFALYAIYPFISSISQIRNAMATAIVIYFLICYIQDPKHKIKKYIFGVILASLFHYSALVYLIFIFAKFDFNKSRLSVRIIIILVIVITFITIRTNMLYNILSSYITNNRLIGWLDFESSLKWATEGNHNWKMKLILITLHFLGYFIFYNIYIRYKKLLINNRNKLIYLDLNRNYYLNIDAIEFVNYIQLLLFILIPFYMLSPTYLRLYINVLPIIYIILAQYNMLSIKINYKKDILSLLNLIFFFYDFVLLVIISYI